MDADEFLQLCGLSAPIFKHASVILARNSMKPR